MNNIVSIRLLYNKHKALLRTALEPAIGYVNRFRKDSSLSNKTKEPTHFHYEHVDFDTLQVREHNFSSYYMV